MKIIQIGQHTPELQPFENDNIFETLVKMNNNMDSTLIK